MVRRGHCSGIIALLLWALCVEALAAVLPEERADLLYHSYDGGGAEIDGPALLVQTNVGNSVALGYSHYVDNVSSASIDVVVTASPYTEQRVENGVSIDYLNQKSMVSLGFTRSEEDDYEASTLGLGISQDMFGDLTTVSLSFAFGDNLVKQNGNDDFEESNEVRSYRLGLTQVLTRNLIMAATYETITDEGYLNNPYRSVRYRDPSSQVGYSFQPELYPNTRTSNAFALRANYYLEQRAALHGGLVVFEDSWGIEATTIEIGYTLPYQQDWIFDARLRLYDQTGAEFYSDLFPFQDAQNFLARDKELSSFNTTTIGLGASYEFGRAWRAIDSGTLNIELDWIRFDYDDFRDLTEPGDVGNEPLYSFDARVTRIFASFWF
jgi:hypothetical protein